MLKIRNICFALAVLFAATAHSQSADELCRQADGMAGRHLFVDALDLYMKAGDGSRALKGQGEMYLRLYDTPRAFDVLGKALDASIAEFGEGGIEEAALVVCMGEAWMQVGGYAKCYECIEKAHSIYSRLGLTTALDYGRLLVLNGQRLLATGDAVNALAHFSAARKLYSRHGSKDEELDAVLQEAKAYVGHGRYKEAEDCLKHVMGQSDFTPGASGSKYFEAVLLAVSLAGVQGETQLALDYLDVIGGLICSYSKGALNHRLLRDYYTLAGKVYLSIGQYGKAVPMLKEAFGIQRSMARSHLAYLSEEERLQMWGSCYDVMNAIFTLGRSIQSDNDTLNTLLYDAALLGKGLLLNASLGLSRLIDDAGDEQLKADFERLKLLQREALLAERQETERTAALQREIQERARRYGNFMGYTDMTWQDVRNALEPGEAAIEFIVSETASDTTYSALVLRHEYDAPRLVPVAESRFNGIWGRISRYLRKGDRVYFAPTGRYTCEGIEYQKLHIDGMACDVYDMHRLTSTRMLAERHARRGGGKTATLFCGLDYGPVAPSFKGVPWRSLPQTRKEGRNISDKLSGVYKVDVLQGRSGSEARLNALSGQSPAILHFATHGFFNPDMNASPLFRCGLVLSGGNSGLPCRPYSVPDDNIATAAEISMLDLRNTALVGLSACRTAQGLVTPDGVFGLQRSFKKAGVGTILMTLDNISDDASAMLMSLFYGNIVQGMTVTKALREAQKELAASGRDKKENWKNFILLDDIEQEETE